MKFVFTLWLFSLLTFISAVNAKMCEYTVPILNIKTFVPLTTCVANDVRCAVGIGENVGWLCDEGFYCCFVPYISGLPDFVPCNIEAIPPEYGLPECKDNDDNVCVAGIANSDCPFGTYCCVTPV